MALATNFQYFHRFIPNYIEFFAYHHKKTEQQSNNSAAQHKKTGESAGARTALAVAGIPLCADRRSSNRLNLIPATRIM